MGIFLFAIASRPALGPTQPPIQYVLDVSSPGMKQHLVKRTSYEAPHYAFFSPCLTKYDGMKTYGKVEV
jgi:hypothetical protein